MNRLAQLREEKGYKTMKDAADALGVNYTTYRSWEQGEREPRTKVTKKIADHYGVSMDYILGRSDKRNEQEEIDEVMELRQTMRERPDIAFLMDLARKGKASDVLQASALLQRLKEESENK